MSLRELLCLEFHGWMTKATLKLIEDLECNSTLLLDLTKEDSDSTLVLTLVSSNFWDLSRSSKML